jgi:membrane fusion protein, heavy metal efflux system
MKDYFKNIKNHTRIQSLLFIGLFSIILTACNSNKKNNMAEKQQEPIIETSITLTEIQAKNANLEMGELTQRNISTVLKVNGNIDVPPQNMISISIPLGGYLKYTKLLPGMHISKGEIIATMEDQQYIQLQQDYLTTQTKLGFTEKEYLRQKELNQSKASSDKVYQQAESDYKTLKITLSALAEKLKLININPSSLNENNLSKGINVYSPINGFVSKVNVNIGKYLSPTDVLFELVNPSDIHLNLKIFEKDLNKLSIGQKLLAYTNSQENIKYPCTIILISKNFSADHSAEVHCHFEKYDNTLIPGMYMNAEIETTNSNCYTLPEDAIVNYENKNYIFVANPKKNNNFEMKEVQVGNKENNYIEILNSSELMSQKIAIKGAYTLLMTLKNKSEE